MPTDMDQDNSLNTETEGAEGAAEATEAPKPAAPVIDYGAMGAAISEGFSRSLQSMREQELARQREQQQYAAPAPAEDEREMPILDDDPDEVRVKKAIHNATVPLKRELRNTGLGTMSAIARETVFSSIPEDAKPYRSEIESELARLDPASRANPTVIRKIVGLVRAEHMDEILAKKLDSAIEARLKAGEGSLPGNASGRLLGKGKTDIPTPEEMFGEDSPNINLIEQAGGPDRFAQKMSQGRYANWADYVKAHKKLQEARKANKDTAHPGAVIFRRPQTMTRG